MNRDANNTSSPDYVLVPREPTEEMIVAGVVANQDRMVADVYRAMLSASPVQRGEKTWRCFHCDEEFGDADCAAQHFGRFEDCLPACQIGVEAYRKMEDELASWRSESDPASKEFYRLGAAHNTAVMHAEENGYERGLKDGRAEPPPTRDDTASLVEAAIRALPSMDDAGFTCEKHATIDAALAALTQTMVVGEDDVCETCDGSRLIIGGLGEPTDCPSCTRAKPTQDVEVGKVGERDRIIAAIKGAVDEPVWNVLRDSGLSAKITDAIQALASPPVGEVRRALRSCQVQAENAHYNLAQTGAGQDVLRAFQNIAGTASDALQTLDHPNGK